MNTVLSLIKDELWEQALEKLRPIWKSDPENIKVLLMLGLCNYKLGNIN